MTNIAKTQNTGLLPFEHYEGCWRISNGKFFGQVKKAKHGRSYDAEIRRSHDGALIRYAGIWNTRKEAFDECLWYLTREYDNYIYQGAAT